MHADVDDKVTDVEEDDDFESVAPDETVVMSEESFDEGDVPPGNQHRHAGQRNGQIGRGRRDA